MNERTPWQQQPGEPDEAYAAAQQYFALRQGRSLRRVALLSNTTLSRCKHWSSRWAWGTRAAAYDAALPAPLPADTAQRSTAPPAPPTLPVEATAHEWQVRRAAEREAEWQAGQALLAKVHEMLACSLDEARWNWRDASALLGEAGRLMRRAADEQPTSDEPLTVRVEYADAPAPAPTPDERTSDTGDTGDAGDTGEPPP